MSETVYAEARRDEAAESVGIKPCTEDGAISGRATEHHDAAKTT